MNREPAEQLRGNCVCRRRALWSLAAGLPAFAAGLRGGVSDKAAGDKIRIIPRAQWVAVRSRPEQLRQSAGYSRMTIHHAGGPVVKETDEDEVAYILQGIMRGHLDRRYGDIGYHFIVDYAGRLWEGRSLVYQGAHVVSNNVRNIGILVLGNFETQRPSQPQLTGMTLLVDDLRKRYGIPVRSIYGHRDLGQSVCPGKHLYEHVRLSGLEGRSNRRHPLT